MFEIEKEDGKKVTIIADTHTHTNTLGSDGKYPPIEQVMYAYRKAKEAFYEKYPNGDFDKDCEVHWEITDHNTIAGYDELKRVKLPENLKLHCGVEIECYDKERDMIYDVTVHNVDPMQFRNTKIGDHYQQEVADKKFDLEDESAEMQYEAFKNIGLELPILLDEDVRYRKTGIRANDTAHDEMFDILFSDESNPTETEKKAKEYLLANGYNPERGRSTYYRKFICNPKSPFYLDQTKGRWDLKEMAYWTLKENPEAIICLSHPGVYSVPIEQFIEEKFTIINKVVEQLEREGIEARNRIGIEVAHRSMTLEDTEVASKYARDNNLIYTSESDFHDPNAGGQKPFTVNLGKNEITNDMIDNRWLETNVLQNYLTKETLENQDIDLKKEIEKREEREAELIKLQKEDRDMTEKTEQLKTNKQKVLG